MPGVVIGGYPLVRTFAHGALGELHLASDPESGAPVAIKTVRLFGGELTRERFLRESNAAAACTTRRSCALRDRAEGKGKRHRLIAMEWVAGSDLSRYTRRRGCARAWCWSSRTGCRGTRRTHAQGVVHRDVKPANLFNRPRPAEVADFGCAHLSDAERSRSGVLAGTPVYMAPEQLAGAQVDGRCDLYALGVALFELLTGHLPFEAASMGELLADITRRPAPSLAALRSDLPAELAALVARLLAKPPEARPADGQAVANELRHIAQSLAATLVSPEAPAPAQAGTMAAHPSPPPPSP
jgi:serine/threonine-protein kinase